MADELVPFRIEITDERLTGADGRAMRRAKAYVDGWLDTAEGAHMATFFDYARHITVAHGKAPQPVVTVIQAIAMGHDLTAVLDLLEKRDAQ